MMTQDYSRLGKEAFVQQELLTLVQIMYTLPILQEIMPMFEKHTWFLDAII